MTRSQGTVIVVLLAVVTLMLAVPRLIPGATPRPLWEYHVVTVAANGGDSRTGFAAMSAATVNVPADSLAALGADGWELVGTLLETETAFPNFGNDNYVNGLQPNVRPQLATLIFKRQRSLAAAR